MAAQQSCSVRNEGQECPVQTPGAGAASRDDQEMMRGLTQTILKIGIVAIHIHDDEDSGSNDADACDVYGDD